MESVLNKVLMEQRAETRDSKREAWSWFERLPAEGRMASLVCDDETWIALFLSMHASNRAVFHQRDLQTYIAEAANGAKGGKARVKGAAARSPTVNGGSPHGIKGRLGEAVASPVAVGSLRQQELLDWVRMCEIGGANGMTLCLDAVTQPQRLKDLLEELSGGHFLENPTSDVSTCHCMPCHTYPFVLPLVPCFQRTHMMTTPFD